MALASLFGGLALANAGLGAVHGFAAPIGGRFPAPHGAVCAALLPHVMRRTCGRWKHVVATATGSPAFARDAGLLTGDPRRGRGAGWNGLNAARRAEDPIPCEYGLGARSDIDELVSAATRANSMRGNPIALGTLELRKCWSPPSDGWD